MWSEELGKAVKEAMTEPYLMSLAGVDRTDCMKAVNQGIDSHLEACFVPERGDKFQDDGAKLICLISPESMPVLIRRLLENGSDLASCICYTLNIELV